MASRIKKEHIIIFITCNSKKEARRISKALIAQKLIACGNIIPGVDSLFLWKGKLDRAKEVLLIAKTRGPLFEKILLRVQKMHSYEVPEIICLPILKGNRSYLKWIDEVTEK